MQQVRASADQSDTSAVCYHVRSRAGLADTIFACRTGPIDLRSKQIIVTRARSAPAQLARTDHFRVRRGKSKDGAKDIECQVENLIHTLVVGIVTPTSSETLRSLVEYRPTSKDHGRVA